MEKITNKQKILNYCKNIQCGINGIDYLNNCIEIINALEKGNEYDLDFCANNYGLDEYIGLCEIKSLSPIKNSVNDQINQCKKCWKIALDGEIKMKYKYKQNRNIMPDGKKSNLLTCYECKQPQIRSYITEDGKNICQDCKRKDEEGSL